MPRIFKNISRSETYKYVQKVMDCHGNITYCNTNKPSKQFNNERDAAKNVDLVFLKQGKEPVNILIRK